MQLRSNVGRETYLDIIEMKLPSKNRLLVANFVIAGNPIVVDFGFAKSKC